MEANFGTTTGRDFNYLGTGMMIFSLAVGVTNFKIVMITNSYNFMSFFLTFGSIIFFVICYWILNDYFLQVEVYN